MSWLSKLFGSGDAAKAPAKPAFESIDYKGFRITPQPISESGGYRISALIEGEVAGESKTHKLIRADVIRDEEECAQASIAKAQQMIDQMGTDLF
jgi:hypothetical protein